MDLSEAFLRRAAARPVALLLTVGVLSVGVSACGSSSQSTASKPPPTVVRKEAAGLYKDVQLTVVNKSSSTLKVNVCDGKGQSFRETGVVPNLCPEFHNHSLAPGKTAYRTSELVDGNIWDERNPRSFRFYAENPAAARPFIKLYAAVPGITKQYSLAEGTLIGCLGPSNPRGCGTLDIDGFKVVLYRDADTARVKVLSITIVQ